MKLLRKNTYNFFYDNNNKNNNNDYSISYMNQNNHS